MGCAARHPRPPLADPDLTPTPCEVSPIATTANSVSGAALSQLYCRPSRMAVSSVAASFRLPEREESTGSKRMDRNLGSNLTTVGGRLANGYYHVWSRGIRRPSLSFRKLWRVSIYLPQLLSEQHGHSSDEHPRPSGRLKRHADCAEHFTCSDELDRRYVPRRPCLRDHHSRILREFGLDQQRARAPAGAGRRSGRFIGFDGLADGDDQHGIHGAGAHGSPPCSGGRTRTLNNWTRTSRVADYTTPEWVDVQISRAPHRAPSSPEQGAR